MSKPSKKPYPLFILQGLLLAVPVALLITWATERFSIGIDTQGETCLPPTRIFLIDRGDRALTTGNIFAFAADHRVMPWFPQGKTFIKKAGAVAGERVLIGKGHLYLDGDFVGVLGLLSQLKQRADDFDRNSTVADGHLFAVGSAENSFDSRYWGDVSEGQVIGRAYPIY